MTNTPCPSGPIVDEVSRARNRVVLGIYDLEIALARVIGNGPGNPVLRDILDFCAVLRQCKLRFFQNDRQEPGAFDCGAEKLVEDAWHFLGETDNAIPADSDVAAQLRRVREGVKDIHIRDIQRRLNTPIEERLHLDQERFGGDWNPVREIRWDMFEPVGVGTDS